MASQALAKAMAALTRDSGPPLYYLLTAAFESVTVLRLLSLACASIALVAILRRTELGAARFTAAALLAAYPPAVLFAVDARAYALCAMFVALGALWLDEGRSMRAATALVLAAYSHYYGVLFFPVLLAKRQWRAFFVAIVAFVPGFWLASRQPSEATEWLQVPWHAPLTNLSVAGDYPYSLFAPAPLAVIAVALVLLAIALVRSWRFAPMVLIPLLLAMLAPLAGRPVYFPMRFESVLAAPLALWAATSLAQRRPALRSAVAGALLLIGVIVTWRGIVDHLGRPLDPYRAAALRLRKIATAGEPVVASGYLYLEAVTQLGNRVIAYPREQGEHPGWRLRTDAQRARAEEQALPSTAFLWIGERAAPELQAMRATRSLTPLHIDDRVVLARVAKRP